MKRSGLERSDSLSRLTPMSRAALTRSGALTPGTGRLRPRSAKMADVYSRPGGRRDLVATLLADRPWCEAGHICQGRGHSTEVHEIKSRARGGSILDQANCLALCHDCHDWITTHPYEALERGWLANSWD